MAMTCPVKGCHSSGWCVHKKMMAGLIGGMVVVGAIVLTVILV